jgi:hypothetical protein
MFMDMQSCHELEDLVKYDADNTAYQSPEENVEHALSLLTAHGTWLLEHRAESVER